MSGFDPPLTTLVKGVGFNSAMEFAERELGGSTVNRMLQELGEKNEANFEFYRLASARVPLASAAAAWSGVAELHGGTQEALREFFRRMGVHIADSNLRRTYKTLMGLMVSPQRLSKLIPTIWKTYFHGLEVKTDLSEIDQCRVRCTVLGFGGAPHIGEMAEGWMVYSYKLCGAVEASACERNLERGARQPDALMDFAIQWSTR